MGTAHPSAAIPRSTTVSSTGFSHPPPTGTTTVPHPPPAGVTGTTSTLTDSVFLSGSASSRKKNIHSQCMLKMVSIKNFVKPLYEGPFTLANFVALF